MSVAGSKLAASRRRTRPTNRHARRLTSIAVGKLSGIAVIGEITSFIATFGTASTGTAIASLSPSSADQCQ
jgi:hypothetical protein